MRILLAPDKFKGTFAAAEVCRLLREGILERDPRAEVLGFPIADGGEGTLDFLLGALGGDRFELRGLDPLGMPLVGRAGRLPDGVVVVESAAWCGLSLVPEQRRNPLVTSTYGLGVALRQIFSRRPPKVIVGLGGSATVEGGLGLARALGWSLLDAGGALLEGCGADLERLATLRAPAGGGFAGSVKVTALCDVNVPLTGPEGPAALFAPQKGASEAQTRRLEDGLRRFAAIVRRDLGMDVERTPGAGAAGGLGAGLAIFAGADLAGGAGTLLDMARFDETMEGVDLVVTGEGAFDAGSLRGKGTVEVASRARRRGIPVILVCARWSGAAPPPGVAVLEMGSPAGPSHLKEAGRRCV